ncbi:hypothetical protein E5676_scaffold315G00560 [Cucumis melo var. makuwa]|uniref:Uncharacterized protein n=1 Tax=Cucumis melo var. makuwa TaxID=1194695 RepID=A0A5D3CGX3_CUCMM|nr:hypothetical protein E6C27_scaffold125G00720 [Cucumis melo var. makuwa]TYK10610.1 hypothetical protein E5676_scaffold315G00560 [Cucumis melo var. makuwa]
MLQISGERSSDVRNYWKCTCSQGNGLSSRTSDVHSKKLPAIIPRTQFSRPVALTRFPKCQKPLEMQLQQRKRAELEDFQCSSLENASENAKDSVYSSWGKKRSPNGFFPLLRIGHKYSLGCELVGGRAKVRLKTVQKMVNTSNEWRTLVWCQKQLEMPLQRRKWAKLEDFQCSSQTNVSENAPDLVLSARTPRTSNHTPSMLPHTFYKGISLKVSSFEGELSKGNGLHSRTFDVRPKKMRARIPWTQFSHPGVKSSPPTISSLWLRSKLVGSRTKVRLKIVQKLGNASKEWRTLVRCQKPLKMHLQQRKWAELEDFWCSSQQRKRVELDVFRCSSLENASENALDSVFSSCGEKQFFDDFFPLLRIGHQSFDLRGSYSEDFNPHS